MAKYGSFKYSQAKYGVSSNQGGSTVPNNYPPIGGFAPENNGTLGTQSMGIGNNLSSPDYISADNFMDNILR